MTSVTLIPMPLNVKCLMTNKLEELQYHSLKETYKFLCHLIDPQKTPRIPKKLRDKAKMCLKYYPTRATLEELQVTVDFFNPR